MSTVMSSTLSLSFSLYSSLFSRLTHSRSVLVVSPWRWPHRKHHSSVAVYGPLLSNGCCIFPYLAIVAYQRVYISQYLTSAFCPKMEFILLRKNHSSVAVYGSLLSNGCCIFPHLAVVAYQRVYMLQYLSSAFCPRMEFILLRKKMFFGVLDCVTSRPCILNNATRLSALEFNFLYTNAMLCQLSLV
jgi:hypothetical protein